MPAKRAVVVDTNVPVTANGRASHASAECEAASRKRLLTITRGHELLVVDDGFEIFGEYLVHLSTSGQPGVGDLFLRWVNDHQFDPARCERVVLSKHSTRGYAEFPDDPDLSGFDPADRKFAAAALASRHSPSVLNAVDSDWWQHRHALARHGVTVDFVCEDQFPRWEAAARGLRPSGRGGLRG